MKKLFSLLAIFSIAATMSAQVTFNLINGSNESWYLDSWENLNNGGWWRTNPGDNAYVIFQASETTYIQGYTFTLTSNSNSDGHLPYTWTLYGSNDQGTWEVIHYQKQANNMVEDFDNPNINVNNKAYTFYCNSKIKFEYYKLNITAKERGNWGCFQISRFDLIPSDVGIRNGSGNALDGRTDTKLEGNVTQTIEIELNSSTTIKGYQFTTANDTKTYSGRNPKNWILQGRSSDSEEWTTIETKTNNDVMEGKNYYPYTFVLANVPSAYKYYKFTITGVQGGTYLQLSEAALITDLTACTNGNFEITSAGDLMSFAGIINTGIHIANAKLTANIDMKDVTYTPIGTDSHMYTGTFDGNGHSINFAISSSANQQAFVGVATGGTTIQNLVLTGSITSTGSKTGGFIAEAKGGGPVTITNCGNEATITGAGGETAAIVANNWGYQCTLNMTNVYNTADVSGTGDVSTICACQGNDGSVFENVYNAGTVTGASQGNFVRASNGTYTNCYSTTLSNDNASIISTDAFQVASGELCYKLGSAFTQDLSDANYPTFGSKTVTAGQWFNTSDDDVYYNEEGGAITVYQLNLDEGNTTYSVPANVTAKNVTMARNLASGKWNTFCSPVAVAKSNFSEVKELTDVAVNGDNYTMTFGDPAGEIVAGKPYLVKVESAKSELTATDVPVATAVSPVTINGLTFNGTFTSGNAPMSSFIISNNNFYNVNSTVALNAFRGYITVGAGVKALNFTFNDEATGINAIDNRELTIDNAIYNVAGQRLQKMQKGINIVNGRKVLK